MSTDNIIFRSMIFQSPSIFSANISYHLLQGDPPVHSEGDQPWDFFGRNDAKAETPVLWPPHAKS